MLNTCGQGFSTGSELLAEKGELSEPRLVRIASRDERLDQSFEVLRAGRQSIQRRRAFGKIVDSSDESRLSFHQLVDALLGVLGPSCDLLDLVLASPSRSTTWSVVPATFSR